MMYYKTITTYQKRWWHLAKKSNKKEKGYLGAFLWRRGRAGAGNSFMVLEVEVQR
jgi:hypothetical protein